MAMQSFRVPFPPILGQNDSFSYAHFIHACDTLAERPTADVKNSGDVAWIRNTRTSYVNDNGTWVQVWPSAGSLATGVNARSDVAPTAEEFIINHNLNSTAAVVTWSLNWPAESYEDEASRTANAVKIKFQVAAHGASPKISWRAILP
jgi:hypothetical protein